MSTSDAEELELRVVGETSPPLEWEARTERTSIARQEDHLQTLTWQESHCPAIRREGTHKAESRREDVAVHCVDSKIQIQNNRFGSRYTSSLFLKLSSKQDQDNPELRLKKKPDSGLDSSTESQRTEAEHRSSQVNGTSQPYISIDVAGDSPLSEIPFPAKKDKDIVSNGLGTNPDLSNPHYFGVHEHNGLYQLPCRLQPGTSRHGSDELGEDLKDCIKPENQTGIEEVSEPSVIMLSSAVVTVLAPHWSGRLRRNKRFEGTGNSESQDTTNTEEKSAQEGFPETQHSLERMFTDGSHPRVPFLSTRRNTVGWSSNSGPASLDYDSKRKVVQSVSLDVNYRKMDHRKTDAETTSPIYPLSPDSNEQNRNARVRLSSLSSKPTTSSLLLSLRRFNTNSRGTNVTPTHCEINPSPMDSSPSDQDGKLFTAHIPQTFRGNIEQEKLNSPLSPSSIPYRATETDQISSPSLSNHVERDISKTHLFSSSPTNRFTNNTPFAQTAVQTESSLSSSRQTILRRGPSESQLKWEGSGTNLMAESSPRQPPYDRSVLLKTRSLPRRATLTSASWWTQVSQEGSSVPILNDITNINNKQNTPSNPPCNDNNDTLSSSMNNSRFSCRTPNTSDNNNTTESICKSNMNLVMITQQGTRNLKQRNTEAALGQESDRCVKQQFDSSWNSGEPQISQSSSDVLSHSKISRAPAQTTLSHPKDLRKNDVTHNANVSELPPTLLNPKCSTSTESSSKYKDTHCPLKTKNVTAFPHKDSQKLKHSLSLTTTNTLSSQTISPTCDYGAHLNQSTPTCASFQSPMSSQTNIPDSLFPDFSSLPPKSPKKHTATPLGFERSYVSIPKLFQHHSMSNLLSSVPNTNCSPTSSTPSCSPDGHSSSSSPSTPLHLLTPPATPNSTSPLDSETPSPKKGRTFSNDLERDPKTKRVRRVTWEDSAHQQSELLSQDVPNPLSSSKSQQSIRAPSIFSFLRSSSTTTSTTPLCPASPKTSYIQVGKGGKYRSLSSDSADMLSREWDRSKQKHTDAMTFNPERKESATPRQERTLSVESGTVQGNSPASPSPPPDFSSGYKLRYSCPPYSTLMSCRTSVGETKNITPRSPLFQRHSQSKYTTHLSSQTAADVTLPKSEQSSPLNSPKLLSCPSQNKSLQCCVSQTDQVNKKHCKNISQDHRNGRILLVDNRVHFSSQSLQNEKAHSTPTYVTETLVYSIKSVADAAPPKTTSTETLHQTASASISGEPKFSQQSNTIQSKGQECERHSHSNLNSSGSSSADSKSLNGEGSNRGIQGSVINKSRSFSLENNNGQSPKKSFFVMKKNASTPNSTLSRSDSERIKANKKMDQVFNKLKQTFRRSDDDISFPWKWKRASQTTSVSGSSDISSVSNATVESDKTLEEQDTGGLLMDTENRTEGTDGWAKNRYTLIPSLAVENSMNRSDDRFFLWPENSNPETNQQNFSESKTQTQLTIQSPTTHQFDVYKDTTTDQPSNQLLSCRDPSPSRSPNHPGAYPTQFKMSTSSSRSPFSPFSSLSPVSPFSSTDVTDDSVFYSPKLQRRRESSSPCEPGEGISLGGSRRSRASTGPPSASPGQDKEHLASSYADLKYGIEPGRSFSVSSVLSCRPSGPGRISTGSRVMSVGDLPQSALTNTDTGKDYDQWSAAPEWTTENVFKSTCGSHMSYFHSDPDKMRSRSLPRSLTRRLANWGSEVSASPPVTVSASKSARRWSPCHLPWDTVCPPTPPLTPPLSPISRRMSKPPSISSPIFPSSSGEPQESQSSRGHLPSRGYISSLSTFEESSDSSSDTTTDDEYYLETGEDEEKETEL